MVKRERKNERKSEGERERVEVLMENFSWIWSQWSKKIVDATQTVWPNDQFFFIIWPSTTIYLNLQKAYKLCQSVLKPNKPSTYCQIFLNICQRGGILPNLVGHTERRKEDKK